MAKRGFGGIQGNRKNKLRQEKKRQENMKEKKI